MEAVVRYFKVLSQHFPGGAEENNEKSRYIASVSRI